MPEFMRWAWAFCGVTKLRCQVFVIDPAMLLRNEETVTKKGKQTKQNKSMICIWMSLLAVKYSNLPVYHQMSVFFLIFLLNSHNFLLLRFFPFSLFKYNDAWNVVWPKHIFLCSLTILARSKEKKKRWIHSIEKRKNPSNETKEISHFKIISIELINWWLN